MSRTKYLLSAVGLFMAAAVGLGMPSAAHAQTTNNNLNNVGNTTTTVSGNCSGIFVPTQVAVLDNDNDQNGNDATAILGTANNSNTVTQGNSSSQTANFSPTCVIERTTVVQQVQAPEGAVKAGAGAAAAPLFGFSGSLASAAYGLYRLRKHVL